MLIISTIIMVIVLMARLGYLALVGSLPRDRVSVKLLMGETPHHH